MIILRWDDAPPRPWKNGGGSTRELLSSPPGSSTEDFDWRISVADITAAAPFSHFPGVRRRTAALTGAVGLVIDGEPFELTALTVPNAETELGNIDSLSYDGALDVRCEAPRSRPTRLLNVMTRWPDFDSVLSWAQPADRTKPIIRIQIVRGSPR
jgi:environmental stress-induced protein Ves